MQDTSLTEKKNWNLKTYFAIDYKQFFNKKEIKIAQNCLLKILTTGKLKPFIFGEERWGLECKKRNFRKGNNS